MRLKELYIKGFKSFADETIIRFEEDIIGIVGPNGSGKSNVVDAIRWVLGEQKSKELRLENMGDVIFNGTKDRKKGKVAHVAVTFENTKNLIATEYAQIKISRLLYASGDSEYRLNDVPCRLKDIKSLLMDTGIGSNSYAIIALGMVDDILANKDNARRKMFEQAAGISKYKIRKRQTLLKLKGTEEDLARVEDLLHEITGQLKSLEKQAKRTEKYYRIKEEYAQISIQHAVLSTGHMLEKRDGLKKRITEEQDALRQLEINAAQQDASLQDFRKKQIDYEQSLSGQQRIVNEITDTLRQLESDLRATHQEKQFKAQEIQKLAGRKEHLLEQIQQLQDRAGQAEQQLAAFSSDGTDFDAELIALTGRKEQMEALHSDTKTGLDSLIQEKNACQNKRFDIEKKRAILEAEHNGLLSEQSRRKEMIHEQSAQLDQYATSMQEGKATIETLEKEHKNLTEKIDADRSRKEELEQMRDALRSELQKKNRALDASLHEHDLLKSMIEKYEGFPDSIKFLAQEHKWNGPAPLLTDIIGVEDEYRLALEAYLTPYLNHFVVTDVLAAKQAIDLLSDSQKGKASFFILNAVAETRSTQSSEGICAMDVLDVAKTYRPILQHLLGHVYIVDQLPQQAAQDITYITKDGAQILDGYTMSGGSVGLFEGKRLGRKKQLEKLAKQIKKLTTEKESLEQSSREVIEELQSIALFDLENNLRACAQRLNSAQQSFVATETRYQAMKDKMNEHESFITSSTARIDEISELLKGLEQEFAEIESVQNNLDTQLADADSSYQDMLSTLNAIQAEYNEKQILKIQRDNKKAELEREIHFNNQRVDEIRAEVSELTTTSEKLQLEITAADTTIVELEASVLSEDTRRKEEQAKLSEQETDYYNSREKIHGQEDELRDLNKKVSAGQRMLTELKEEFNEVKINLSSVRERLRVEFDVDLDDVSKERDVEEADPILLGEKVEKLRKRINNFGEINPLAIEAYKEIEIRFNSISDQRNDILDAKESLLQTIEEIEQTATAKFLEAFDKVRTHFIEVFRSLFKAEDNCDLILIDPSNPLESEIEIIAKPKGKRPKSLSQLSGGEKTLTATALLFALYLLKPAPFCVFDEVDAPLDDANIEKFNRIIKKFAEQSQFIIVTHNKSTMAAVDVIYGIYMETMGISNLSQVDFRHLEHSSVLATIS